MFGPKLTIPQLFARQRVFTRNPNVSTATAPPTAADGEQRQRDLWFAELVERCQKGRLLESSIVLALHECGRSRAELDDALDRAKTNEGKPATSPVAKVPPVLKKESPMTAEQKREIRNEWDAALRNMQSAHPNWSYPRCLSAVVKENPELHARYIAAANCR